MSDFAALLPLPALREIQGALGEGARLFLVGGALRDLVMGRPLGDIDLATNLMPEEVLGRARGRLRAIPTGLKHGTVTLMAGGEAFEITTFRSDGEYLDGRRPESVQLGVALEEDLARRDFTINAMALPLEALADPEGMGAILDPFGGRKDLEAGLIRAVGDPLNRFAEDGLRTLRACRFASQLAFEIEGATLEAISRRLDVARKVAVERVFVELTKLLCGQDPARGLRLLEGSGLMELWMPELCPLVGCPQNKHHRFDVWGHTLEVVTHTPPEPELRWAALLHDTGKPGTRTGAGEATHFYGHEGESETLAHALLIRLRASHALIQRVQALVRHHGQHPDASWSQAACRRLLRRLKEDGLPLEQWGAFRLADQLGKGKGEEPCRSEHEALMARMEALARVAPPLDARALALDGHGLMALAGRPGGPWLARLQQYLLEQLLEEPGLNTPESLQNLARSWLETHP